MGSSYCPEGWRNKSERVLPDPLSTELLKILSLLPNPKPGACVLCCLLLKDKEPAVPLTLPGMVTSAAESWPSSQLLTDGCVRTEAGKKWFLFISCL